MRLRLRMTGTALALSALALAGALALAAGCGGSGGGGGSAAETPALQAAMEAYLKKNSMDLAVVRLQEIKVSGEQASAAVVLKEREAIHNVTVTWKATFRKAAAGGSAAAAWEVEKVER